MDARLLEKMLGQSLRQYGRNVANHPLSPLETSALIEALRTRQEDEPEEDLHIHIEDVIYDYVTNQGLFS
ncbi:YqzH family protein [Bacillus sp. NPDC077027]|uniref:YqzH family protein n=1 Tax=Bacillus sp. NPDC077027 TaxID=3390548 RepID=UPI003D095760